MVQKFNNYILSLIVRFQSDEEGLALTEYLLLLGLLTAAVITSVLLFGDRLGALWATWVVFLNSVDGAPAALT